PDAGYFGMTLSPEQAEVVVLPVPFEATVSYRRGTKNGPETIRKASHQLDFFDRNLGKPYLLGIASLGGAWLEQCSAWNKEATGLVEQLRNETLSDGAEQELRARVNDICRQVHDGVRAHVDHWGRQDKLVMVVGGDHSIAYGSIASVAEREGEIGVLQIDAHADLRVAYEGFQWSHASIMNNIMETIPGVKKLVSVGVRDFCESEYNAIENAHGRIEAFYADDVREAQWTGESFAELCVRIVEALPEKVYISFDIDGMDPTLCPSTGTPVPGGLLFEEVSFLLKTVLRSGRRIVGLDLCEVAPGADDDEWDGNVGARILYKLMGYALKSQGKC
ncbi:MAG: agmatinase family protein, partial [Planctomycetota bacterium]|nr:agmatinase family protein [Planctomycetota bacterium]